MLNRFLFYVQDSRKYFYKCFKDDCISLIVLPRSRSLCNRFPECGVVSALLLHLSGDVELNPGPDDVMQKLLEGQKRIALDVGEIRRNQEIFSKRL